MRDTGWRRPIGCFICIGHFPQKSPMMSCSFVKNDLQLQASHGCSPPCTYTHTRIQRERDICVCVCVTHTRAPANTHTRIHTLSHAHANTHAHRQGGRDQGDYEEYRKAARPRGQVARREGVPPERAGATFRCAGSALGPHPCTH